MTRYAKVVLFAKLWFFSSITYALMRISFVLLAVLVGIQRKQRFHSFITYPRNHMRS